MRETLAPFRTHLTLQRLVMEAAANRDFAPIHFDREAARATGAPDVYANTILLETLIEACVRNWAGLSARITEIAFAMRGFNCVGDVIEATGEVVGREPSADGELAHLQVWVESHRGRTVEGTVTVLFPDAPSR